jgi:hypothetical protein
VQRPTELACDIEAIALAVLALAAGLDGEKSGDSGGDPNGLGRLVEHDEPR